MSTSESRKPDLFYAGESCSSAVKWIGFFLRGWREYAWKAVILKSEEEKSGFGIVVPTGSYHEKNPLVNNLVVKLDILPIRSARGWFLHGEWGPQKGVLFDEIEKHIYGSYPLTALEIERFSHHLAWFCNFHVGLGEE